MQFFKDLSWSSFTAGFVAVLVGFTSSIAIVFQAAQSFGATPPMLASWLWAIGIGMGLATALPSLWLRKPVMVAWSTPGAAVLASAGLAGGYSMGDAVGAFMMSAGSAPSADRPSARSRSRMNFSPTGLAVTAKTSPKAPLPSARPVFSK